MDGPLPLWWILDQQHFLLPSFGDTFECIILVYLLPCQTSFFHFPIPSYFILFSFFSPELTNSQQDTVWPTLAMAQGFSRTPGTTPSTSTEHQAPIANIRPKVAGLVQSGLNRIKASPGSAAPFRRQ